MSTKNPSSSPSSVPPQRASINAVAPATGVTGSQPALRAKSLKVVVPKPGGGPPPNNALIARKEIMITKGGEAKVTWSIHAPVDSTTGHPRSRTHLWMVAEVAALASGAANLTVPLQRLGAQNRADVVFLRIVGPKNPKITLKQKDGVPMSVVQTPIIGGSADGFYQIDPLDYHEDPTNSQMIYGNLYELFCDSPACRLEAWFMAHPPGSTGAQAEDGGPPGGDPSDEN